MQAVCDCNNEPMRWRICPNNILRDFTTRPCRSVIFRCDDEKYVFRFITTAVWCAAFLSSLSADGVRYLVALIQLIDFIRCSTTLPFNERTVLLHPYFVNLFRNFKFSF